MTKILAEYYFQSFKMSITKLLISDVEQNAHEKIIMKIFAKCYSQSSEISITELLISSAEQDIHEKMKIKTLLEY